MEMLEEISKKVGSRSWTIRMDSLEHMVKRMRNFQTREAIKNAPEVAASLVDRLESSDEASNALTTMRDRLEAAGRSDASGKVSELVTALMKLRCEDAGSDKAFQITVACKEERATCVVESAKSLSKVMAALQWDAARSPDAYAHFDRTLLADVGGVRGALESASAAGESAVDVVKRITRATCAGCGVLSTEIKTEFKTCSGCGAASFCGQECFRRSWQPDRHKGVCAALGRIRANVLAAEAAFRASAVVRRACSPHPAYVVCMLPHQASERGGALSLGCREALTMTLSPAVERGHGADFVLAYGLATHSRSEAMSGNGRSLKYGGPGLLTELTLAHVNAINLVRAYSPTKLYYNVGREANLDEHGHLAPEGARTNMPWTLLPGATRTALLGELSRALCAIAEDAEQRRRALALLDVEEGDPLEDVIALAERELESSLGPYRRRASFVLPVSRPSSVRPSRRLFFSRQSRRTSFAGLAAGAPTSRAPADAEAALQAGAGLHARVCVLAPGGHEQARGHVVLPRGGRHRPTRTRLRAG